ncbi:MAG: glycosyltransferase family 9 protein [Verrucomicrobiae bacterium]|nr:glycosyltransferase family 9 protein [Verrucomicrobiae bacterium]
MGKILFIRGGAVGDFILTLPAIQLVREQLPEAEVEVLGYPPVTRLAEAAGLAHRTRSIEYGPLSSFFVPNSLLSPELMDYFKSFSVVISYLYDPDGFFGENLKRCGVDTLFVGPHKIDLDLADQPAASQLARPLEQLALFLEKPHVALEFDEASKRAADDFFDARAVEETVRWVALHPGSGSPRKNWSFEGWIRVAENLSEADPTLRFLIVSGEAEDRVIAEFHQLLDRAGLSHASASHLSLPVLGAILQRCELFLGHDSGISHLAAACGVPAVLLFGPTDPGIWAPQNPDVTTIQAPGGDLSKIKADEVTAAALESLTN